MCVCSHASSVPAVAASSSTASETAWRWMTSSSALSRGVEQLVAAGGREVAERLDRDDEAHAGRAAALEPGAQLVAVEGRQLVDEHECVRGRALLLDARADRAMD